MSIRTAAGADLPFAPAWSGRVDVQCSRPLNARSFTADLGVNFRDDYHVHPSLFAEAHQDAYAKPDSRLGLAGEEGWTVALMGRNLTNEKTFSQGFETPVSAPPGATQDDNTATQLLDAGRNGGVAGAISVRVVRGRGSLLQLARKEGRG